ncbi:trigger factor [Anabaena cylindrica FACHB-243]|uniref:Trigger factor n=1 Tax=Anabaena cylindrica (strain ATCC 27899 / PCC 7122) TaxID=272123 RepID=K9ZR82_ANACC|nr:MULTISPECIES: trigger factor [Anabaena]AFZ60885.1 Trigger factor [Anabaena cylindrica PCC 7122]MBD2420495.1 trigger factor [Anabaena cylindrica FACHB-243]MBY5285748.1 trigger factor [Anabaena sp. CCAP 1446/1C]MBY5309930.1 trigger factor [Anabaena sp. CCAP 1446/1C]MCM2406880.1 trigger factor [Anabaena sp. CCAP 1446/1C]
MKVTQEKLDKSQIGLEIEITPEITKQKYEQVIRNLSGTVNIPGFRKGKVPRQILLQRLGVTRIKAAALEELIPDGIEEAVKQEAISAIGQPRLLSTFDDLIKSYEPGQPLTISAAVDVEPEINLAQYTGLAAKAEEIKYDPTRVDDVLDKERQEMATLIPVEGRAAQIGDIAVVDFKGVITKAEDESAEPTPIPGGEATDFKVELQEDKFIPGFVSGMVGMNPGETREIPAQFPDPYANEDLAGKPAIFTVTLKEIKEKELPELNDDFAQEVSEFETLEQLRASLEERYQTEAQNQTKVNQQEALLAELLKHVEVDLPATLIDQEIDAMLAQTAMKLSQQGLDVKKLFTQDIIPQLRERSQPEAIERLKRSLSIQEIGKRESIKVTAEEVAARVKELLEQYADEDIDQNRLQSVVENELLTEKILDWLVANSSVELVPQGSLSPTEEPAAEAQSTEAVTEEATASPE